jgi:hypothetical protein
MPSRETGSHRHTSDFSLLNLSGKFPQPLIENNAYFLGIYLWMKYKV